MKVLVVGTAGLQVCVPIQAFPLEYESVRFYDDSFDIDIAGVGFSYLKILSRLEEEVTFLTGIGNDDYGSKILNEIKQYGNVIYEEKDKETLLSVIIYDETGRRSILRDGKKDYLYRMSESIYNTLNYEYDYAMVSLSNFARDILPILKDNDIPICTDIQTIDNLTNEYSKDFMDYSDIIFFSNDHFDGDLDTLVSSLYKDYNYTIIGVGLGERGALLCDHGVIKRYQALKVNCVNTVGAGDTLFSVFMKYYMQSKDADYAIKKAIKYTSIKIQSTTASKGILTLREFEGLKND